MPDRPTKIGIESQEQSARGDAKRTPSQVTPKLFAAMPRGWVITIFAAAAWLALVLVVLGVLSLFPD